MKTQKELPGELQERFEEVMGLVRERLEGIDFAVVLFPPEDIKCQGGMVLSTVESDRLLDGLKGIVEVLDEPFPEPQGHA